MLPDVVAETFAEATVAGGHPGEGSRAARMLEWRWDPDPHDTKYRVDFAILLRDEDGNVSHVHEHHDLALFPRRTYWSRIAEAGFEPVPADVPMGTEIGEIFLARRL